MDETRRVGILVETGTVGGTGSPTLEIEGSLDGGTTTYNLPFVEADGTPNMVTSTVAVPSNMKSLYVLPALGATYGEGTIVAERIRFKYTIGTSTTGSMQVSLVLDPGDS